ncbi:hypothetical protein AgCh_009732 [Apium graveolens]
MITTSSNSTADLDELPTSKELDTLISRANICPRLEYHKVSPIRPIERRPIKRLCYWTEGPPGPRRQGPWKPRPRPATRGPLDNARDITPPFHSLIMPDSDSHTGGESGVQTLAFSSLSVQELQVEKMTEIHEHSPPPGFTDKGQSSSLVDEDGVITLTPEEGALLLKIRAEKAAEKGKSKVDQIDKEAEARAKKREADALRLKALQL